MPENCMDLVLNWLIQNPSFTVYFWIDKETAPDGVNLEKTYHEIFLSILQNRGLPESHLTRIEFKDIVEQEVVSAYSRYEINRLKPNYGASSDDLRYRILFKFGGAYFDSDVGPGECSLEDSGIFDMSENEHCLYVDTNSQNEGEIGNDALITTAQNSMLELMSMIIARNYNAADVNETGYYSHLYIVDPILNREIYGSFVDGNFPARQLYGYDRGQDREKLTIAKTGPIVVRDIVGDYISGAVNSDNNTIHPFRVINSNIRVPIRRYGNQWLSEKIFDARNIPDIREVLLEKAINSLQFEVSHCRLMRLDAHIEDMINSWDKAFSNQINQELIAVFLTRVDQMIADGELDLTYIIGFELTYQYSEVEQFIERHRIDRKLTFHFMETTTPDMRDVERACHYCAFRDSILSSDTIIANKDDGAIEMLTTHMQKGERFLGRIIRELINNLAVLSLDQVNILDDYWPLLGSIVEDYHQAYHLLKQRPSENLRVIDTLLDANKQSMMEIVNERGRINGDSNNNKPQSFYGK